MQIHLKNFQGHADTIINADGNVTAIVGKSDHGKTSVLRAFNWWRYNRPLGHAFMRRGTTRTEVTIDNISHIREGKDNFYDIGNGKKPSALKGKVPVEVERLFRVDEVNIQKQFGSTFLLDKSPGICAQVLSTLIDISGPQVILDHIKKNGKALDSQYKALNAVQAVNLVRLEKYKWLDEVNAKYSELDAKRAQVAALKSRYQVLGQCLENVTAARTALQRAPDVALLINTGQNLLSRCLGLLSKKAQLDYLKSSIVYITDLQERKIPDYSEMILWGETLVNGIDKILEQKSTMAVIEQKIKLVRKLSLIQKVGSPDAVLATAKKLVRSINEISHFNNNIVRATALIREITDVRKEEDEAAEYLTALKRSIGECPLCGGDLNGTQNS